MKRMGVLLLVWLACVGAASVSIGWMLCAILGNSPRAWSLARSFDRVLNTTTGGSESETLSSRANRLRSNSRWACILCNWLEKLEKDHCKNSAGI